MTTQPHGSCYFGPMKTITLTEAAYERLLALKQSPKDSFSKVILRNVPARGTGAQVLAAVRSLPTLSSDQGDALEAALSSAPATPLRDPWAK